MYHYLLCEVQVLNVNSVLFIHNIAAFISFSEPVGPANCVGKNFALMEMRMVITFMASRFDLAFGPDYTLLR